MSDVVDPVASYRDRAAKVTTVEELHWLVETLDAPQARALGIHVKEQCYQAILARAQALGLSLSVP